MVRLFKRFAALGAVATCAVTVALIFPGAFATGLMTYHLGVGAVGVAYMGLLSLGAISYKVWWLQQQQPIDPPPNYPADVPATRPGLFLYNKCFLAKACPEPCFKYFSKIKARCLEGKAQNHFKTYGILA
jgi:hypothetical protein